MEANSRWRNHILIADFRWRRLACDALFMSFKQLGKPSQICGRRHLPESRKQSAHIQRTLCSSSQSVGINGCMRQETREMWRTPRCSPTAEACAHRKVKTKEKAKAKDSVTISQRAAQIINGVSDEKERDNVCPRCDRELYAFRTSAGPIMRCRGWDLVGTPCTLIKVCEDEAVNFREKNTNRTEDRSLATGSGARHVGPHAGLGTNTLPGQDGGSQDPTLSNDWTAQIQYLMSNPELAQEQFAQWQFLHQHYQQQLAASSNLESWQMFQHSGEDGESVGGQSSLDTRMDQTGV